MTNEHTIRAIAEVCHEVNRAYCQAIGDNSQPEWDEAPDWQQESATNGVRFHVENDCSVSPAQSHENWLKEKISEGWRFGETKDPELKIHPCLVPYGKLPVEQRVKDYLFGAVVKALVRNPNLV